MYLIGVAAPKGGVGKSTLSFNLAWYWHKQDLKVCIVDIDKQQTLTDLADKHDLPFPVYSAVPESGFDLAVIDHPPTTDTKIYGDIIVSPMRASNFDRDSFIRAIPSFSGKKVIPVVNVLKLGNKLQKLIAIEVKKSHQALWVKDRSVFETSTDQGLFVGDVKASRVRYQAADEISIIAQKVESCLTS